MQTPVDPALPPIENWADYIDRLSQFEAPTPRLRRTAWKLDHPENDSPASAAPLRSRGEPPVRK